MSFASDMTGRNSENKRAGRTPRPKRRYDYPETLYTAPRVSDWAETRPISPVTQTMVPAPLQPRRPNAPSSSGSVYSCEQWEAKADSPAVSPKQSFVVPALNGPVSAEQGEDVQRRDGAKFRRPQDSGVETLAVSWRYSHLGAREPAMTSEGGAQHLYSEHIDPRDLPISPRSTMFVFGQGVAQHVPTAATAVEEYTTPKPQSQSTNLRHPKPDGPKTAAVGKTSRFTEAVEISPPPKRWRFDSLRKSVGDISASLKQMAGRKRSRDEEEEAPAEQRPNKFARIVAPTAPRIPALPPDVSQPLLVEPSPTFQAAPRKRNARALVPQLRLSDASVQALLTDISKRRSTLCAELQNPVHRGRDAASAEESTHDPHWTTQERAEFGAYVRAAEGGSWRMNVDQAVEGARRARGGGNGGTGSGSAEMGHEAGLGLETRLLFALSGFRE